MSRRSALGMLLTAMGGGLASCGVSSLGSSGDYSSFNNPVGRQGPPACWVSSTRYLDSIGASSIDLHYQGKYRLTKGSKTGSARFDATVALWSFYPAQHGANIASDARSVVAVVKEIRLDGTRVASRKVTRKFSGMTPDLSDMPISRHSQKASRFDDNFLGVLPSSDKLIAAYAPSRKAAMLYQSSWYWFWPARIGSIRSDMPDAAYMSFSGDGLKRNPLSGSSEMARKYKYEKDSIRFEASLLNSVPLQIVAATFQSNDEFLEYSLISATRVS